MNAEYHLFQFVIPMAIITYCYFRILRKVSQDMIIQNVQFSASLSQKQRVDAISRKKKVSEPHLDTDSRMLSRIFRCDFALNLGI